MVKTIKQLTGVLLLCSAISLPSYAQSGDASVKKGNDLYRKGDYANAELYYRKALLKEPGNVAAKFNLGNAMEKQKKGEDAAAMFNDVGGGKSVDTATKAKAYYNKGLALAKDNKLQMAIDAFKQALRLAPDDEQARENLQKAMNELRQQQQQKQDQKQNQQPQPQKQQPKPQQEKTNSKLNQSQAEEMLGQLRDNEKQLQRQIQKGRSTPNQNKKDW
ncbi:tetratricopeptide repeat protein [Filimonas effusa]|uniref:Tetratricopeptide repeat protein n=1 Tax=Filimonas effusa TaxID=2508721 RepID=A0A4Q1D4R2_9BACT|nr:tetratricopeptide repeat protein [Filimonas effusa]RXK83445.1 tetratricopeptide repeat protein [Filimonas effusa]